MDAQKEAAERIKLSGGKMKTDSQLQASAEVSGGSRSLKRVVSLRRCCCGCVAKVSVVPGGVWIECRLGDEGCMDIIFARDMDRAKKLWNEEAG